MFSVKEKQHLANVVEKAIRELNHPEMDNNNIHFNLKVEGKESWSWANIHSNSSPQLGKPNEWNEKSREIWGMAHTMLAYSKLSEREKK